MTYSLTVSRKSFFQRSVIPRSEVTWESVLLMPVLGKIHLKNSGFGEWIATPSCGMVRNDKVFEIFKKMTG